MKSWLTLFMFKRRENSGNMCYIFKICVPPTWANFKSIWQGCRMPILQVTGSLGGIMTRDKGTGSCGAMPGPVKHP